MMRTMLLPSALPCRVRASRMWPLLRALASQAPAGNQSNCFHATRPCTLRQVRPRRRPSSSPLLWCLAVILKLGAWSVIKTAGSRGEKTFHKNGQR
jgi:hypothetical protein